MRRRIGIRLSRARDAAAEITFRPIIVPAYQLTPTGTHFPESFSKPKTYFSTKYNAGSAFGLEPGRTCIKSTAATRWPKIDITHSSQEAAQGKEVLEADIICLGVCGGQGASQAEYSFISTFAPSHRHTFPSLVSRRCTPEAHLPSVHDDISATPRGRVFCRQPGSHLALKFVRPEKQLVLPPGLNLCTSPIPAGVLSNADRPRLTRYRSITMHFYNVSTSEVLQAFNC